MWCLWFGFWLGRCSRCLVMGCGLVPGPPVVAVLFALRLPSPRGAQLCRRSWGSCRCAIGSIHGWVGVLLFCALHRVGGAWGVCTWCSSSAPVAGAVEVVSLAPRYVTVVRDLGAILRAVQAWGTMAWCGACGSVCGAGSVVSTLRWCEVWSRVLKSLVHQLLLCCSLPCRPPPVGSGCVDGARVVAPVPLGRYMGGSGCSLLCAVHRVGGAWGVCAWCLSSAPVATAAEVVGVGRVSSPLSGPYRCRHARRRRCGFPVGVVLALLLHHVLCLCRVCGLSCAPCTLALRCCMCVYLMLRGVACACILHTGRVGCIHLALSLGLGFLVAWVLPFPCSRACWSRRCSSFSMRPLF